MYTSAKPYFYGTGRRKKSVARVRLYAGTGNITVNGRDVDDYFGLETLKLIINQPLMHALGIEGTVRASFSFYNTKEEIDTFIAGVERVRKMF